MVPLPLQTTIDNELAALISDLAIKQPAYFAAYARYWQGKRTHTTPPADGIPTAAYTVHAYNTRAGQGYVIHADVIISGVYHRKSVAIGPATWLTQTWRTAKVIKMS